MATCDEHLRQLDNARASYEALTRMYCEARDHHRTIRGKLRREYYAFVKAIGRAPDAVEGIEAKVAALVSEVFPPDIAHGRDELATLLDACEDSKHLEQAQGNAYCRVHNELREVVARSKEVANECYDLAMQALKMQSTPLGRARYVLFQKKR
ncbi:MAG: hypothetical protein IT381_03560 [Deltaproteobacteria bacterium]|nr:hypothetical protein [Deltaproteobacteria bacterium]